MASDEASVGYSDVVFSRILLASWKQLLLEYNQGHMRGWANKYNSIITIIVWDDGRFHFCLRFHDYCIMIV